MARILPRFDFRVEDASDSVVGHIREGNEDAVLLAPELALFGLADGMGGLSCGEIASALAIQTAKEHLSSKEAQRSIAEYTKTPTLEHRRDVFARLRGACEAAHTRLLEEQEKRNKPMGSTLDLCLLVREKAFIAHVGDGRVFLVRPRAMLQLTEDHVARDPASARAHPARKAPRPLVSGVGLATPLRVDAFVVDVRKGDVIVLTTDGAYGPYESEAALGGACRGTAVAMVDAVIKHSLARGGRDNASMIALKIEDRLVARPHDATKPGADLTERDDMLTIQHCPLFVGLSSASLIAALSSGIEVETDPGHELSRFEASDLCAYVIIEGVVKIGEATLGPPALVYAESLVGVDKPHTAVVSQRTRCLRIRRDDFREVAENDPVLGLSLYQRLAGHLARH